MSEKGPEGGVHSGEEQSQATQSQEGESTDSEGCRVGPEASTAEDGAGGDGHPQEASCHLGNSGEDGSMEILTENKPTEKCENQTELGNEHVVGMDTAQEVCYMNDMGFNSKNEESYKEKNDLATLECAEGAESMSLETGNRESEASGGSKTGAKPKKISRKDRFMNFCFGPTRSNSDSESDEEVSKELIEKFKNDKESDFKFFWKSYSPFSQWYMASFTVDGIKYNCAEQYMMHQKALLMGDTEKAELIMALEDPQDQKATGREVDNFDEQLWQKHCQEIVKKGNMAKFTQNECLLGELISTHPKILVEASPVDRIWGIGLSAKKKKAHNRAFWRGQNLLGYILTEVRDEIMREQGMMDYTTPPSDGQNKESEIDPQSCIDQSNNASVENQDETLETGRVQDEKGETERVQDEKAETERVQDNNENIEQSTLEKDGSKSEVFDSVLSDQKPNEDKTNDSGVTMQRVMEANSDINISNDSCKKSGEGMSNVETDSPDTDKTEPSAQIQDLEVV